MPYSGKNDSSLPDYVKKRDDTLRSGWVEVFNRSFEKYGESRAFAIANSWLKTQLSKNKKSFVKRSAIEFQLDSSRGFIKRDISGNEYITFVLNSNQPHKDRKVFSDQMLQKWADYINQNQDIIGDMDHLLYDKILNSNMSDDMVRSVLKGKKGIAKALQAIYKEGKLWVRAIIDKRYKKIVENAKGVSAEALCTWEGDMAVDGELLGFSFNINTSPADYQARVVSA